MRIEEVREILHAKYAGMELVPIRYADLVFEQRVRLKCFYCRNYKHKWTCTGLAPSFDYPKLIGEYDHLAVVMNKLKVSTDAMAVSTDAMADYRRVGNELHRAMLELEAELFRRNNPMAVSFIAGYCDLCPDGCPKEACAHPEQARVPWDATGCNIVRSLANIGITVDFASKDICRYGLLLW